MIRGVLFALAALSFSLVQAEVTVETKRYQGWEVYWISNEIYDIAFAPEVGRIVHFSQRDAENLLWLNEEHRGDDPEPPGAREDWVNYGGAHLWLESTASLLYKPDPFIDPGTWTVVENETGLEAFTPPSNDTFLSVGLEIRLESDSSEVEIIWSVRNVGASPRTILPRQIATFSPPSFAVMADAGGSFEPVAALEPAEGQATELPEGLVQVLWKDGDSVYLRSAGLGVAAVYGNLAAGLRTAEGAESDSGNRVLFRPSEGYGRLELLTGEVKIAPAGSFEFRTVWTIGGYYPEDE
jgi:hypothetical protein